MSEHKQQQWKCGADLVVRNLEAHGTTHVFGIPGAKVDRVFDSLEDSSIETVVVRHEASAGFMAGAIGRMTGKAGVALATSGPGISNVVTAAATATSEGDPMVAIGGAVKRDDLLKQVHQTMDTTNLFRPITKSSVEVTAPDTISEVMSNAFRVAETGRPGATFVSLPMDIVNMPATGDVLTSTRTPKQGAADEDAIKEAAAEIRKAKRPVILLGMMASRPENVDAIRALVSDCNIPVVGTFQAAGALGAEQQALFAGRIGLFNNQPADELIQKADAVITIGYNPVEYDPPLWNKVLRPIIHIDVVIPDMERNYRPTVELIGDINATVNRLKSELQPIDLSTELSQILDRVQSNRKFIAEKAPALNGAPVHPFRIVKALEKFAGSDVNVCVDMGSFHIWLVRYFNCFRARQLMITNGQQTMGVSLPWGIAACLANPGQKVLSVSGDGSFMQCSMELETAVRLNCNLTHVLWVDQNYNMVAFQEYKKYQRVSGTKFGPIDFKAYAESCGAKGFAVNSAEELESTLKAAMDYEGTSLVAIPVDYSHNSKLMEAVGVEGLV